MATTEAEARSQPARELRKGGIKIKLHDQPFQILTLLLERAGETVTREEIQERLWPGNTFVEFDNGLNVAVKKLRTALCDDAERPRFVETVPRRGYRFIAPVSSAPMVVAQFSAATGSIPAAQSSSADNFIADKAFATLPASSGQTLSLIHI